MCYAADVEFDATGLPVNASHSGVLLSPMDRGVEARALQHLKVIDNPPNRLDFYKAVFEVVLFIPFN